MDDTTESMMERTWLSNLSGLPEDSTIKQCKYSWFYLNKWSI